MTLRHFVRTAFGASFALLPTIGLAADILVTNPYARVSRPNAPTGAAFMEITNNGPEADRLLEARSNAAKRVELHTHVSQGDGIMVMTELEDGIALEQGITHIMKRGGDHVMLMGLSEPWAQRETITVTLVFEKAGEVTVTIPVDNMRQPSLDHTTQGDNN